MAKSSKNRDLNRTSARLSGQYVGDRLYEQTRYKLACLIRLEIISSAELDAFEHRDF